MVNCARCEPTIDEIMADPVVKALMKADRVDADRLQTKLRNARRLMSLAVGEPAETGPMPAAAPPRPNRDAAVRQFWG